MVHPLDIQYAAHSLTALAANIRDDLADSSPTHATAARAAAARAVAASIRLHQEITMWIKALEHAK